MDTDALFIDQYGADPSALPGAYTDIDLAGVDPRPSVQPRAQTAEQQAALDYLQSGAYTPAAQKVGLGDIPRTPTVAEKLIEEAKKKADDTPPPGDPDPLGYREDLRAVYYNIMYAHPGAGRSDIKPYLEPLRRQSISLFFLHNGLTAWDLINNRIGDQPLTPEEAKRTLEVTYRDFLNGFLSNPAQYRAGRVFQDKLNTVTRILGRLEREPGAITTEGDPDFDDRVWVEGIFGGDDTVQEGNRLDLLKLHMTGGGQGYYSSRIHKVLAKQIQYFKDIGRTPGEIFATMMGMKGEGAKIQPTPEATATAQQQSALADLGQDQQLTALGLQNMLGKTPEQTNPFALTGQNKISPTNVVKQREVTDPTELLLTPEQQEELQMLEALQLGSL